MFSGYLIQVLSIIKLALVIGTYPARSGDSAKSDPLIRRLTWSHLSTAEFAHPLHTGDLLVVNPRTY